MDATIEGINQAVEQLRAETMGAGAPVRIENIAIDLGIDVYRTDFGMDGVASTIIRNGDTVAIALNGRLSEAEQRIALAHDLFLAMGQRRGIPATPDALEASHESARERTAAQFARALTMPVSEIEQLDGASVDSLAETFNVPREDVVKRLFELDRYTPPA